MSITTPTSHNLLIVDDDAMVGRALRRALKSEFNATIATNAVEAVVAVRTTKFDCVLCDVHMPDIEGEAMMEQLSEVDPALASRVVFMSGGVSPVERQRFEEAGHVVIPKPFDIKQVKRELSRQCLRPDLGRTHSA